MSRASPTLIDRIESRSREIDTAVVAALACAKDLPAHGSSVSLIPGHLHTLRARIAALRADLACLVAMSHAAMAPAPAVLVSQGRDGTELSSTLVGASGAA